MVITTPRDFCHRLGPSLALIYKGRFPDSSKTRPPQVGPRDVGGPEGTLAPLHHCSGPSLFQPTITHPRQETRIQYADSTATRSSRQVPAQSSRPIFLLKCRRVPRSSQCLPNETISTSLCLTYTRQYTSSFKSPIPDVISLPRFHQAPSATAPTPSPRPNFSAAAAATTVHSAIYSHR